jgi:chromosome segregation ATPase
MSILSTLALMVSGFVAKTRQVDPRDTEIAELKAKIDDLNRQLNSVRDDRDGWMRMAEAWRARYYGQDSAMQQIAQAQQQAQQLMDYRQQAAAYQGQLGQLSQHAAYQDQQFEGFCNCVPARHDLLLGANAPSNPRE